MPRAQAIRWAVEVASQVFNCADVGTCGIVSVIATLEFLQHHFPKSGHKDLLMTRQLTLSAWQSPLRSPHAKRLPQGGYVQTRKPYKWIWDPKPLRVYFRVGPEFQVPSHAHPG